MEVKINIETGQLGDTVIELFKNLTQEKKEELALQILKEWLQSPESFETRAKEEVLIEEFRSGKRKPQWGSDKFDYETPELRIKNDTAYQNALKEYKNSKQIMMEEIKNEIVNYYKNFIEVELKQNEIINKVMQDTINEITNTFPEIINKVLIDSFAQNLVSLKNSIYTNYNQNAILEGQINMLKNGRI